MDTGLDLDAVRRLSAWLAARRDLTAHLDVLSAFGPSAAEQIARNVQLVDELHVKEHQAWLAYRAHVLGQPAA